MEFVKGFFTERLVASSSLRGTKPLDGQVEGSRLQVSIFSVSDA